MRRQLFLVLLVSLLPFAAAADSTKSAKPAKTPKATVAGKAAQGEAKELSGMSVLGNSDTPKALVIVPWKGSELGPEADLRAGLLNDAMTPVDKEVFLRELEFYQISNSQP